MGLHLIENVGHGSGKLTKVRGLIQTSKVLLDELEEASKGAVVDVHEIVRLAYQIEGYMSQIEDISSFSWKKTSYHLSAEEETLGETAGRS